MKKLIALLMMAVMVFSLFALAGCNKPEEDNSPITIWQENDTSDYFLDYNDHPITLYIEKKFGIDLSFQLPAEGGEQDAFNVMYSTEEFTDVIKLGGYANVTAQQMYDDGYLYDLAPYIEQYMPNYKAYLDANPKYRAAITTEEGRIFGIVQASPVENEVMWGGLIYRHDILETMTGGYVSFPSGNAEPTTIADWEYMLNLFHQYFQAAGMADYACLILPYNGVIATGELTSGFGIGYSGHYVKDGKVQFGATEQGYYNYLAKMAEWYAKGWIYKDFATRVNDPIYMPNTALTYGGAAGVWFGGNWQLGGAMSLPEYGLIMNVKPVATPLDTEHGVTESHALMTWTNFNTNTGMGVTTKCSEAKMIKYMTAMDFFFSKEGSEIVAYGPNAEVAEGNEALAKLGMGEGIWSYDENGQPKFNACALDENGALKAGIGDLYGVRYPGIKHQELPKQFNSDDVKNADKVWTACGRDWNYPAEITLNNEQQKIYQKYNTDVNDCINEFTVKVITGQIQLNETTWAEFQANLKAAGMEQLLNMYTEAYNNFMGKMAG